MTAPVKTFPNEAASLDSTLEFQKTCQQKIPEFDLSKVIVTNRSQGEADGGHFDLLYDHPDGDLFCSARVHWPSHQMQVSFGSHKTPQKNNPEKLGVIHDRWMVEMKDACTFTSQVAGAKELGGKSCTDGYLDGRMKGAEQFTSYRYFQQQCQALASQAHRQKGFTVNSPVINTSNVRILTQENVRDDDYQLLYTNVGLDFFCRADISSLQGGSLTLTHGALKDQEKANFDENLVIPTMTDGCSMTRALVGEKKMANPQCTDHTQTEQDKKKMLNTGLMLGFSGAFYYSMFRLGRRWAYLPLANWLGPKMAPLTRPLFTWMTDGLISTASRLGPSAGQFATSFLGRAPVDAAAGAAGSRLTLGSAVKGGLVSTLLIIGIDQFFEQGVVGDSYKNSVNKRVTQMVYEAQGLYDYSGWRAINPLSYLNKTRRLFRAMAPSAMSWAVSRDNQEVTEAILKADQENSVKAANYLGEVLPPLLGESETYQKETLGLLKAKIELSTAEQLQGALLQGAGVDELKKQYSLTDAQVETLSKKLMLKEAQDSIRFLMHVQLPQNAWARELFNEDGSLKPAGETKLLQYYPAHHLPQAAGNSAPGAATPG